MSDEEPKLSINNTLLDIATAVKNHTQLVSTAAIKALVLCDDDDDLKLVRLCKVFREAVRAPRPKSPPRLHANVDAFSKDPQLAEDPRIEARFYRLAKIKGLTALAVAMQDNDDIASELNLLSNSSLRLIIELADAVTWHNDLEKIMRKVNVELPRTKKTKSLNFSRRRNRKGRHGSRGRRVANTDGRTQTTDPLDVPYSVFDDEDEAMRISLEDLGVFPDCLSA